MGRSKSSSKREVYSDTSLPQETRKISNNITLYLKELEKEKQIKPKIRSKEIGTSLVEQWLGICLPMQGTWVQSLVGEDPTCHAATKPMCHNY